MFGGACPWRGVLLPIVLMAIGGLSFYTGVAWLYGRDGWYSFPSTTASTVQGLMFVTLGIGLHLRHSWHTFRRFAGVADLLGVVFYALAVGLWVTFVFLCVRHVIG